MIHIMKLKIPLSIEILLVMLLFFTVPHQLLKAQGESKQSVMPTEEALRVIRKKSLKLLRDIVPSSTSGKALKTVDSAGGLVYWGNLFEPHEVVALVNLPPEKSEDSGGSVFDQFDYEQTWGRHLSFCAWEKDHWVYRQYLDNARNLEFHDRKDKPKHFVQASRKTGRYDGDHLSWFYDEKRKKLVRTNFEDWGPFYLIGNYLCTIRGFERRAMDETVWAYPYAEGKKGRLLAVYYSDIGSGELKNFSITFHDRNTGKWWTYSFSPTEDEPPYIHYSVDAVEGIWNEPVEKAKLRIHSNAEMEVSEKDNSTDEYCFERLTGLSRAVLGHVDRRGAKWMEKLPKLPALKQIKLKINGDPEISLLFSLVVHGAEHVRTEPSDLKQIKRSALEIMEDVVPHQPATDELVRIYGGKICAIWGKIFGDAQFGALVAVQNAAGEPGSSADLCLLLWQDGWKFVQSVGKVPSRNRADYHEQEWDWRIMRHLPNGPFYVINNFDVYGTSNRQHLSWICDPKTHSLRPTGWPKDARPSISGTTITFRRWEKSEYATTVYEIDQFSGKPGKCIAAYSITYDEGRRACITIRIPDPATGKLVTWRMTQSPPEYHDRFSLCYSPTDGTLEPFHEDATVDVLWGKDQYPTDAISFLIWRLTGIKKTAQQGMWDEEMDREKKGGRDNLEITKPAKTVVVGIPEAVKAFSWPDSQARTEP